ncbi:unnamed protein product [Caenorhabditis angaria]|uniref:Uncharacterized protein n=1 Tax=Caenorhabditis angaria TaxID=860376 RepID=A0A9P1J5J0_9PELO|nr:unnamed protein product [Caenorhabditis angaria]
MTVKLGNSSGIKKIERTDETVFQARFGFFKSFLKNSLILCMLLHTLVMVNIINMEDLDNYKLFNLLFQIVSLVAVLLDFWPIMIVFFAKLFYFLCFGLPAFLEYYTPLELEDLKGSYSLISTVIIMYIYYMQICSLHIYEVVWEWYEKTWPKSTAVELKQPQLNIV